MLHSISLNCQHLDLIIHSVTVSGDGDKSEPESEKVKNRMKKDRSSERTEKMSE